MKILCLLGSPRPKGNSAAIADRFCSTAESLGADVKTYTLNKLQFRGCQACYACKKKLDHCILDDDLTQVLEEVKEADVLVLATPIYFGEITAQLKGFIDRTFSYLPADYLTDMDARSRIPEGKKLVFIITQGDPDKESYADVFPRYEYFFEWYGFDESFLILAAGVYSKGEIDDREDVLKQAEITAKRLMASV